MLLRKNKFQISLAAIIISLGVFSLADFSLAQTAPEPTPGENNLIVNFSPNPLFTGVNFLPGDSKTGEAEAINNTAETKRAAAEAINFPKNNFGLVPADDISHALEIIIREKGGNDIYGGTTGKKTLSDFYYKGEIYLSSVPGNGGARTYQFIVSFPAEKGDEWQGKTTKFDIIVGLQGEEGVVYCNNNGIQDNSETGSDCGGGGCSACSNGNNSGSGGGGNNTGGGGSVLPPGLVINYIDSFEVGLTSAKIKWFTSHKATSQVIYCKHSENCVLDLSDNTGNPPLYGYKYTTSEMHTPANPNGVTYREIELTGLEMGTVYDYRTISHASPPTISRSYNFATLTPKTGEEINTDKEQNASAEEALSANPSATPADLALSPAGGKALSTPAPSTKPAAGEPLLDSTPSPDPSSTPIASDEKSPDNSLLLASIGNILTLGTGEIWINLLILLIIACVTYYFIKKEKRKKKEKENQK